MHFPPIAHLLSFASIAVFSAVVFNAYTGVRGMNNVSRKSQTFLIGGGFILGLIALWQTANQSWENERLIANISGGDSYLAVVPQPAIDGKVPLNIWNKGHSILSGITVTVSDGRNFNPLVWPTINVGTLPSWDSFNLGRLLPYSITPAIDSSSITIDGEKVDTYMFYMTAQNGMTVEVLQFKKGRCIPWVYRYWVTKSEKTGEMSNTSNMVEGPTRWVGNDNC
jgi:hypothetical protein